MAYSGKIILNRTGSSHQAGFCILKPGSAAELHWLHAEERRYFDGLKYEKRRNSYLSGRIAAKKAILELFPQHLPENIWIDFGVFGFPVVKSPALSNIKVCISHCDGIAVAIAFPEEHPLGIDIEQIDPDRSIDIATLINAEEKAIIAPLPCSPDAAYTTLWSVKEAVSKIFMTGLTISFELLLIKELHYKEGYYEGAFVHIPQYKTLSLVQGQYTCSLIIPHRTTPLLADFTAAFRNILSDSPDIF